MHDRPPKFRPKKSGYAHLFAGETDDLEKYAINPENLPIRGRVIKSDSELVSKRKQRVFPARWGDEKVNLQNY